LDEPVVSAGFKSAVEDGGLTGLDFLWIRDSGRCRALQWYLPLPREPLGRGLDHPWYDPTKSKGQGYETTDPRARYGQGIATSLAGFSLRSDASFGDPIKDRLLAALLALSRRRIVVASYLRFLRQHLPSTDFAFVMRDSQQGDEVTRGWGLAFNRKALDLLISRRLVGEAECVGVRVLDRAPEGVEDLDGRYGRPAPLLSVEEFARLRAEETSLWAEYQRDPKPPRAASLARSLSLLRAAKRRMPERYAGPSTPRSIAAAERTLSVEIPAAWQKVLRVTNGGKIEDSPLASGEACVIIPAENLSKSQREELSYYRDIRAELPDTLLVALQTEIGDSIWLDRAQQKPDGDCRVVLISHETGEEEREWSGVAAFLEELLSEGGG
jgi:hypothetical protein